MNDMCNSNFVFFKRAMLVGVFVSTVCMLKPANAEKYSQDIRDKLYACGYNSLYLFLQLKGVEVDFETLKSNVTVGENGTSLYDLQKVAAAVGMNAVAVKCSYAALCSVDLPVIAWINRNPKETEETVIGHFVVLTLVNDEGVEYLDGTSGQTSTMRKEIFARQWNGMILVEKSTGLQLSGNAALSVFLIGLACILFGKGTECKQAASALLLFLAFVFVPICQAEESTRIWRTKENETVNALCLLLKCHDIPCDYTELEKELKSSATPQSLDALKDHAQKHGLDLDVFQCATPEALKRIPIPFVIHVEDGNDAESKEWQGNFLFVMGRGSGQYMILDCGTLVSSEVSEENLRRYWSGFVLGKVPVAKTKSAFFSASLIISGMTGLAVLLVYWGISSLPKTRKNAVLSVAFTCFVFVSVSQAEDNPPPAKYAPEQVRAALLKTANDLKSLKVYYRSEYYKDPNAPPKTYLYRKILAKSPYFLNHTNSHPCDDFSWDKDPLLQQAFIQKDVGYNIFRFRNCYFVMVHKPDDPLPGTLPGEFFFNATGIWPTDERKAPMWDDITVALRDVAKNANYDQVRPVQEQVDGRWCHVLSWQDHDTLWLDMERGAVLLAREVRNKKNGALVFRYELRDNQEAAQGIWIPKKLRNIQFDCTATSEEGRKRRVIDGFFDVEVMEANTLTEADFVFTPPPGALLTYDEHEPDAAYPYQSVPGGEEMLDRIAEWIRTIYPPRKIATEKNDLSWTIGFLVLPIIVILEIRRRKQS